MFHGINQIGAFRKCLMLLILLFLAWCTPAYALDVTLQWDANTEADLAGYRVYYKTETSGILFFGELLDLLTVSKMACSLHTLRYRISCVME